MPCTMYEGYTAAEHEGVMARRKAEEAMAAADKVTDILCRVLRALPPEIIANMDQGSGREILVRVPQGAR